MNPAELTGLLVLPADSIFLPAHTLEGSALLLPYIRAAKQIVRDADPNSQESQDSGLWFQCKRAEMDNNVKCLQRKTMTQELGT